MSAVTQYMAIGEKRNRSFSVRGMTVLVSPGNATDAEAKAMADALAAHANDESSRWAELEAERDHWQAEAKKARDRMILAERKVPPDSPERLLGVGCVRFDDQGRMFFLNQRKNGWSSFAIMVDGWDDMFRRYNAKVIAHGIDEAGAWWEVKSC